MLSRLQLFVTPWTVARQAPLFMRFPRQEYWSGLPFPTPGALPDRVIEPRSSALGAWRLSHWTTREAPDSGLSLQKSQGSQFPLLHSSSMLSTNFSFFQYSRHCDTLLTWRSSNQIPKGSVCSPCHSFPFYGLFRASQGGHRSPKTRAWVLAVSL